MKVILQAKIAFPRSKRKEQKLKTNFILNYTGPSSRLSWCSSFRWHTFWVRHFNRISSGFPRLSISSRVDACMLQLTARVDKLLAFPPHAVIIGDTSFGCVTLIGSRRLSAHRVSASFDADEDDLPARGYNGSRCAIRQLGLQRLTRQGSSSFLVRRTKTGVSQARFEVGE